MPKTASKEIGIRLSVKDAKIAERALKEFGKEGQHALKRIQVSARPATRQLKLLNSTAISLRGGFGGFAKGLALGLAPLLTTAAALGKATRALEEFDRIAKTARNAGIASDFYQSLAYQADLAGVSFGELDRGLLKFIQTTGRGNAGFGEMAENLRRLNPELLQNIQLATTQEQRLRLIADAVRDAKTETEKAAIAVAAFGKVGVKLVQVLDEGAEGFDRAAAKARDLGIVVDRELLESAEKMKDELSIATRVMDLEFSRALIKLVPLLIQIAGLMGAVADVAARISGIFDDIKQAGLPIGEQTTEFLERTYLIAVEQRELLSGGEPASAKEKEQRSELVARAYVRLTEQLKLLQREKPETPPDLNFLKKMQQEADTLTKKLRTNSEAYAATLTDLDGLLKRGLITQVTYNRAVAEAVVKRVDATTAEEGFAGALEALEKAKAQGIISEKIYADTVEDATKRRLEAQNNLQAGVALGLNRIAEQGREVGDSFADAAVRGVEAFEDKLVEAFATGKADWGDLARTILTDLIRINTRQNITGPISGFLGNLFSGIGGGGGSGYTPGFGAYGQFHDGGIVGNPSALRALPRFHNGGFPGLGKRERVSVTEVGEGIFTPKQMDNADLLVRSLVDSQRRMPVVQIIDQRSGGANITTEVSNGPNGEAQVRAIVRDEIGEFSSATRSVRAEETVVDVLKARRKGVL